MKRNLTFFLLILGISCLNNRLLAQGSIASDGGSVLIDFDNSTTGMLNGTFLANDISAGATMSGHLDENGVHINDDIPGAADVAASFGAGTSTNTNFLGTSTGGVGASGNYAFDVDNTGAVNRALGFQPSGSRWADKNDADGHMVFKYTNNSGVTLTAFRVKFSIYELNNAGRSSTIESYLTTDISTPAYGAVRSTYATPIGGSSTMWANVDNEEYIVSSGVDIMPGESVYLRFYIFDSGGSGTRDEFAIDDIEVTGASTVAGLMSCADAQDPVITCPIPSSLDTIMVQTISSNSDAYTWTVRDASNNVVASETVAVFGSAQSFPVEVICGADYTIELTTSSADPLANLQVLLDNSPLVNEIDVTSGESFPFSIPSCGAGEFGGNAPSGACALVVNGLTPTATDDCTANPAITYMLSGATTGSGNDDASGTSFNVGTTKVLYSATDDAGKTDTCSIDVVVTDSEIPTVMCPGSGTAQITVRLFFADQADADDGDEITWEVRNGNSNLIATGGPYVNPPVSMGIDSFVEVDCGDTYVFKITDSGGDGIASGGYALDSNGVNIYSSGFGGFTTAMETQNIVIDPCGGDTTVSTDAGECFATVGNLAPVVNDNCPNPTVTYTLSGATTGSGSDDASGLQFNAGSTTLKYIVTDASNNSDSCQIDVIVNNTNPPTANCRDITVYLDNMGMATIVGDSLYDDNGCTTQNLTYSVDSPMVDCADLGSGGNGSAITDLFISEYIEAGGNKCIEIYNGTGAPVDLSMYDLARYSNGSSSAFSIDLSGIIADGDVYVVCNPSSSAAFTNEADDTDGGISFNGNDAVALRKNGTAIDIFGKIGQNPSGGRWSQSGNETEDQTLVRNADVTSGNTDDATDFPSLGTEWTRFPQNTSSELGSHTVNMPSSGKTVKLFVEDQNGNIDSCTASVTVLDTVPPMAICNFITVQLDNNGMATIIPADVDGGSTDNCAIVDTMIDISAFDCDNIGSNTVELKVMDASGNRDSCDATVTIADTVSPVALCQDVTVQLDGTGNAGITAAQINNGSSDNCELDPLMVSPTTFNCSNEGSSNMVTLTATDESNNTGTCTATVTVQDNMAPNPVCQDITVSLDMNGDATIVAADVDNGSADNCGTALSSIDNSSFDCDDIGTFPPVITDLFISEYIEGSGNNKCIEIYNGTGAPVDLSMYDLARYSNGSMTAFSIDLSGVIADGDVYVICNPGATSAFTNEADDTDGGLSFNGNDAIALRKNGTAIDIFGKIGQDPGSEWSQGGNGTQNQTLVRNADVTSGNTDDDLNFPSLATEWTQFSEDESSRLGSHTVDSVSASTTLTITDVNGNVNSCTAMVMVEDTTAPTAICQNTTVQLDANGMVSIAVSDINNGSTDNCAITDTTISTTIFSCDSIGIRQVDLIAMDGSGNADTCTAMVTVQDTIPPTAVCQDITVQLDASGMASISVSDINNGSNDNCDLRDTTISTSMFDCDSIGTRMVTLFVNDSSLNADSCIAMVTVSDTVSPVALCQNITVQLNASGNASLTAAQVDNGSSDACGIANLGVLPNSFGCSNVGANTVTLTVTDNNNNTATCTAVATVEDNVAPTALCQNITVALNASGNASLTAAQVDNGSSDACGIANLGVLPNSFDCSNVGTNTVILTVTDSNNNTATCTAVATVEDITAPVITFCPGDTTVLVGSATDTMALGFAEAMDACGLDSIAFRDDSTGFENGSPLGVIIRTFIAVDSSGNQDSCKQEITVSGNAIRARVYLSSALGFCTTVPPTIMWDSLRSKGLIPLTSPYGTGEVISDSATVLSDMGPNSIVDWVLLELRNRNDRTQIIATRSALVQRDGDVVDTNGIDQVLFDMDDLNGQDSFYVVVNHRNHLGAMAENLYGVDGNLVDFTDVNNEFWNQPGFDGVEQYRPLGQNRYALYPGNANGDNMVEIATDVQTIQMQQMANPPNTRDLFHFIRMGYLNGDISLDGSVILSGQFNDVDLLNSIIYDHPNNITNDRTFVIPEQIPSP